MNIEMFIEDNGRRYRVLPEPFNTHITIEHFEKTATMRVSNGTSEVKVCLCKESAR